MESYLTLHQIKSEDFILDYDKKISPIFIKDNIKYGIIIIDKLDTKIADNIRNFNLYLSNKQKRNVERNKTSLKNMFTHLPEKLLFDESISDIQLILLCQNEQTCINHEVCTTYCILINKYFEKNICKIYNNIYTLIKDFPEIIITENLTEINYKRSHTRDATIKKDPNPSQIYQNLYLGEIYHSSNIDFLKKNNIKHILTILEYPCVLSHYSEFNDIKFKHICIRDRPYVDITRYLTECIDFIKSAHNIGENVYVHCAMGISRSASIVIAYIMETQNVEFDIAFNYVRFKRPQVYPNFGFVCQLIDYYKTKTNKIEI